LAALEDKVSTLGQEAARLCGIHPDHADQIKTKHQEIENNWARLTGKAKVILFYKIMFFKHSNLRCFLGTQTPFGRFLLLAPFLIRFPRSDLVDSRYESNHRC
jgi:hypothetical protein